MPVRMLTSSENFTPSCGRQGSELIGWYRPSAALTTAPSRFCNATSFQPACLVRDPFTPLGIGRAPPGSTVANWPTGCAPNWVWCSCPPGRLFAPCEKIEPGCWLVLGDAGACAPSVHGDQQRAQHVPKGPPGPPRPCGLDQGLVALPGIEIFFGPFFDPK